jgi:hypothetical protein
MHKDKIQYWQSMIKECQNQSLSTKQWCKEYRITLPSFYKRKKYFAKNNTASDFSPVICTEWGRESMKMTINGVAMEFDKRFLPDVLKAIQ